jgi:hypothetical protein
LTGRGDGGVGISCTFVDMDVAVCTQWDEKVGTCVAGQQADVKAVKERTYTFPYRLFLQNV